MNEIPFANLFPAVYDDGSCDDLRSIKKREDGNEKIQF
jgi:hypothetical protein